MLNRTRIKGPMLLLLALMPAAASADTITIESDYWIPYNGAPGSGKEGYMIDLLRAIAAESGDEIDYRLMDWDNAVTRSLQGSVDCVVGAFIEDTPDHAMTSTPWGRSGNLFLAHVERIPRLESLEDLRTLRIGVVADYSYGEQIDAILEDPEVQVTRQRSSPASGHEADHPQRGCGDRGRQRGQRGTDRAEHARARGAGSRRPHRAR